MKYCSRLCSSRAIGRSRLKEKKRCPICAAELSDRRGSYCSIACSKEGIARNFIADWLHEVIDGRGSYEISAHIRNFLRKEQVGCCAICLEGKWLGVDIPLQLDHVDGDHQNCKRSNVRLICPNCHALLPTSGSKNRGRGRAYRKMHEQKKNAALKVAGKNFMLR